MFASPKISPHTVHSVIQSHYPDVSILINAKLQDIAPDHRMKHTKLFRAGVQQESAMRSANQQTILRDRQCTDILVILYLRNPQRSDVIAIISAKSIVGTKPNKAVFVLYDRAHGIGRQPVLHTDITDCHSLSKAADREEQQKKRNKDSIHFLVSASIGGANPEGIASLVFSCKLTVFYPKTSCFR